MKNLIVICSLLFGIMSVAYSSTDPVVKKVSLIENALVKVTISSADSELFSLASYDGKNLEFETIEEISFVQIFNSKGKLEFQLPVMSDRVTIGQSLIAKGNYKIGFILKGADEVHFTNVSVK